MDDAVATERPGPVRAGVVPGSRIALYAAAAVLVTAVLSAAVVALFGVNRVFTGVLLGGVLGIALLVALFRRDAVVLTEQGIERRTPWSAQPLAWERVVGGRFTLDERARWALALDLTGDAELVLLSVPPVVRPVGNAYEMRKREQVQQVRQLLREKRIPITVLPEIATALQRHWRLAPPAR
ncbi:hypothetical protein AB0H71_24790 [Nocardia sp. NPDC050697]|uniref:hypothetical protein n=1 Tax=Nocardia sp. NPDC050697 TaxID=3155158 RepID=UPI0033F73906